MRKNCENCGKEFNAKRATAKYCSTNCRVKASAPKPKVVDEHKAKVYDREKNLQKFIKMGLPQVNWITTGIPDFDALTMIPRGRITQIQGAFGVGKTTLCLNMIAGLRDKKVFYIDSEASLNPELLVDLELEPENFHLYNASAYFEDIAEAIKSAAQSGQYEMIIFDSLAACTTRAETEGAVTDRNIGQKAFFMHKLIHMVQMDLKNNDTALVIVNQERETIGGYHPDIYTPGGKAVPYAASLMIRLKTTKSRRFPAAKQGAKKHMYEGHYVEAEIIKSKVNQPWRKAEFKLYYPQPVEVEIEEAVEAAF